MKRLVQKVMTKTKKKQRARTKRRLQNLKERLKLLQDRCLILSYLLIASVIIISAVFAMTHGSNRRLANYTTLAVENTLSIFIAVLWFQAFHTIIENFERDHHQVLLSIMNSLLWIILMIVLTWVFRWRGILLATIAQVGAHIVAFSATHSTYISQKHYYSKHWITCLYGLVVLLVFVFILAVVFFIIKKLLFHDPSEESEDHHVNNWAENIDDIETDFFALAVAFAITEFVRFLIVGKFPSIQGSDVNTTHTHPQRFALLGWAILVTVVGGFTAWSLTQLQVTTRLAYLPKRVISFISALVPGLIAWAFLKWGEWHVYEVLASSGSIFARVIFAIICTMVALLGVTFLACGKTNHRFAKLGIATFALMAAWSWEEAFDETFEESLKQWWSKLWIAAAVSVIVVPIMIGFIKPLTLRIKEEMEEDGHPSKQVPEPPHKHVEARAVARDAIPMNHPGIVPATHPGVVPASHPVIMPTTHPGIVPVSHPGVMPAPVHATTRRALDARPPSEMIPHGRILRNAV